jgi:exopolyphosphatase / guanosine-5'-triphosphate,3'-diphosphate pyrophosphatase
MIIAILDLGTNTFNLLVASVTENKKYQILYKEEISVKLGEGSIQNNIISPLPFQRGIEAIKKHVATAKSYNTELIEAYATSAIRSSENGKIFTDIILKETGIKINVIDGNREAELIYKGVMLSLKKQSAENFLIMDIGGGSTEFILFNNSGIIWKHSYDLGVSRLLSYIRPENPLSEKNISETTTYLKDNLNSLFSAISGYQNITLIGCSGTFESFASVIFSNINADSDPFKSEIHEIDLTQFEEIYKILIKSTEAERYQLKGLVAMRVDTIVLAAIFVRQILQLTGIKKMLLSHYALKEGVLSEYLNKLS